MGIFCSIHPVFPDTTAVYLNVLFDCISMVYLKSFIPKYFPLNIDDVIAGWPGEPVVNGKVVIVFNAVDDDVFEP